MKSRQESAGVEAQWRDVPNQDRGRPKSSRYHSFIPYSLFSRYLLPFTALGLVLLAAWLRLWRLDSVPPGLWFDESFNGMEAMQMLKTNTWPVFIAGGQGREAIFFYLLALALSGLGQTIYAIRLAPALLGIVAVALMYRWARTLLTGALLSGKATAPWAALIATAGLAVSFWYLTMNRVGYRANTLLPVLLITVLLFWRGWQTGRFGYYAAAGLGLGLCQYTYLAGRLVPGIFVVFLSVQTLLGWKIYRRQLQRAWLGLLLMTGVALVVFTPLLLFFLDHPELFWERGDDVSLKIDWRHEGWPALLQQVEGAIRVFIDGQDPNWRHHLVGQPGFDLFSKIGFWLGLVGVGRHFRRPAALLLLSMLAVMWLPALLAVPPFHTLRLVGILPAYYLIMALGWLGLVGWLWQKLPSQTTQGSKPSAVFPAQFWTGPAVLSLVLLISGSLTVYNYFYRWAKLPEVYQAFDGPVVALAGQLTASNQVDVVIPFYLYTQATMRYFLEPHFQEKVLVPETTLALLRQQPAVTLIIPTYPPDDNAPPAYVWLHRQGDERGQAYISAVVRDLPAAVLAQEPAEPLIDAWGQIIAHRYQIDGRSLARSFPTQLPAWPGAVTWADNLQLTGYEFWPPLVEAGETATLQLAWQILSYTGLEAKMFVQLVDRQGHGLAQAELDPLSRKMYRWRDEALIIEQQTLKIEPNLPPGLYFVRLGFFEPKTTERLLAFSPAGSPLGDAWIIGPLYVQAGGVDPRRPQHRQPANIGHHFDLLGYSIHPAPDPARSEIELFWQTRAPVEINYTAFIQLLNAQNQVVAQADAQPFGGLYPTSRWQPGQVLAARFTLTAPPAQLSPDNRLVTGMYDLASGERLPVYTPQGEPLPDRVVWLTER